MQEQENVQTQDHEYVYFISYSHSRGFGNVEVNMSDEMIDIDAIHSLAKEIEESLSLKDVMIINFFPLRLQEKAEN